MKNGYICLADLRVHLSEINQPVKRVSFEESHLATKLTFFPHQAASRAANLAFSHEALVTPWNIWPSNPTSVLWKPCIPAEFKQRAFL